MSVIPLGKLPAQILACAIAIPQTWPAARLRASILKNSALELAAEIPHPAGGFVEAQMHLGDPDPSGQRTVWLSMQALPFGRVRLTGSAAVVARIRSVIEGADEPPPPATPTQGGER